MYFRKKGDLVVFIVLVLVVFGGGFLIFNSESFGLTGAIIGIQALSNNVTSCLDLNETNATYILTSDVTSAETCYLIRNNSITINCANWSITYASTGFGYAVDNSGGYNNITIMNCRIVATGAILNVPAIYFHNTINSTIFNNTIITTQKGSTGIVLSSSHNITINLNNITTTGAGSNGILINGTSEGNFLRNINISALGYSINHTNLLKNSLVYSNSFGFISWNKTNLTTNLDLEVGTTIFLLTNKTGLKDDSNSLALNDSAEIGFYSLSYGDSNPQIYKNRVRCDNTNSCNITSYAAASGSLTVNVSSFSNYTTLEGDPPAVTIVNPANGTTYINENQTFSVTITDTSIMDTVYFMFLNNSVSYNLTAVNTSGNWSYIFNLSTFSEGGKLIQIYANDSLNNIQLTKNVTIIIDRTPPIVNMITNSSNITDSTPTFTFNFTDTSITMTCSLYLNSSLNATNSTTINNTNTQLTASLLKDGNYQASINCTDGSGFVGNSSVIVMVLNATLLPPTFSNAVHSSTTFATGATVVFNITITDNEEGISHYIFSSTNTAVGGWSNETAGQISGPASGTIFNRLISLSRTIGPLTGSNVCWYVWANNTVGNASVSTQSCFTVVSLPVQNNAASGGGEAVATAVTGEALAVNIGKDAAVGKALAVNIGKVATATEVSAAIAGGFVNFAVNNLGFGEAFTRADAVALGYATDTGKSVTSVSNALTSVETKHIEITNKGDKKLELLLGVKEEFVPLENKDNIVKLLREQIIQKGLDLSDEELQMLIDQEIEKIELIERENLVSAYNAKVSSLTNFLPSALTGLAAYNKVSPIFPTGENVEARLLKTTFIGGESEQIVVESGETFKKNVKIKRGISLDISKPIKLSFSSQGQEVYSEDVVSAETGLSIGTAIDVDNKNNKFDTYISIPPKNIGTYLLELEINKKEEENKNLKLPLKTDLFMKLFTKSSNNLHTEIFGPYEVSDKGALLALQLGYDPEIFSEEYEVVGKLFKNKELVAKNEFDNVKFGK